MRRVPVSVLLFASLGCSSGIDRSAESDPAFRVLQGSYQPDMVLPEPLPEGTPSEGTSVTLVEVANRTLTAGIGQKRFSGRVTKDATAVAVALVGDAAGAWTMAAGGPDPSAGGELTWSLSAVLQRDIPPGLHLLRFAAIDAGGAPRGSKDVSVCALPPFPDNLNACDATIPPPAGVLTLSWDSPADLDLVVVTPAGKLVDGSSPSTMDVGEGTLSGDGAGCGAPGPHREHLAWAKRPPDGPHHVFVRVFDACGAASAHFRLTVRVAEDHGDGTWGMRVAREQRGQLAAADASPSGLGLFVFTLDP